MMPSLAGKVALVTGSSQGIGAALAVALAVEGAKVVVSDVQDCADTVEQIAEQGGEAIGVPADVTDNKSLKELVATAETALGPVDVLVNNAGIFGTLQLKPLMQISEEEWDAVFRVNARGVFQATNAVIPSMQRAGGGSIINISSGTVLRGAPMFLHYVGSKGAVFAMTRALALEFVFRPIGQPDRLLVGLHLRGSHVKPLDDGHKHSAAMAEDEANIGVASEASAKKQARNRPGRVHWKFKDRRTRSGDRVAAA
jgi:NAD(P)-dependent dehydrogenase (short-subunit alcohol dehydrogenase family)